MDKIAKRLNDFHEGKFIPLLGSIRLCINFKREDSQTHQRLVIKAEEVRSSHLCFPPTQVNIFHLSGYFIFSISTLNLDDIY